MELDHFDLEDLLECSSHLQASGDGQRSIEGVARELARYLRSCFVNKDTGTLALPLVRCYATVPFERLDAELRAVAMAAGGSASLTGVPCLTLLGTAGEEADWNERRRSHSHRAIPLPSKEAVTRLPMVAGLLTELGLDLGDVISPSPERTKVLDRHPCDVFYVPRALDSPLVPAQEDFVIPYGIRSVLGFGGTLPDGSMFAVVLFSTVPIPSDTADAFEVLALSVKVALLPFVHQPIFDLEGESATHPEASDSAALAVAASQVEALTQLLRVRENAVRLQSTKLRQALQDEHARAEELAASRSELAISEALSAAVVAGALDSVITIDAEGRIIEFNPAAERTFGYTSVEAIGESLADLIIPMSMAGRHQQGLRHYLATGEGPLLNRRVEVTARRADGSEFPVELTVTPVVGIDPPIFTGYLRDITKRRLAESELLESRERMARIAHILQSSLLPARLPEIADVELDARYRPAGDGNEVGGDFYDVFELNGGRWAVVLGDVCGKGPDAAAVTALVRYTVRAAAMRTPAEPAEVLRELHAAMLAQRPDTFCTLAYGVIDPAARMMELILGGHPPALLASGDGAVTKVGGRGPIIGMIGDRPWPGHSASVPLAPGDVVVLYSDGVTEARQAGEFFGSERLEAVVGAAAHRGAQAVAAAVDSAVSSFAEELVDDVAILTMAMR